MPVALDSLRVIIIDDQASARGMLRAMLKDLGIDQVFEAADGAEATAFVDAAADMIDVVICDWNMPRVTGVEVLRQIRGAGAGIPFLMVTGRADAASVMEAKGAGVSAYLAKPFSKNQLEAKLRAVTSRRAA